MSDSTLIQFLSNGVKATFRTSAVADRVKIYNDSPYYLRVYFGSDAPAGANMPGWHETVGPGDHPLLGITGASASAFSNPTYIQSTPYAGVITILPFFPVGATWDNGGVVNGAAYCSVTAFYPGEYAAPGNQTEAFVQAAKQQRSQSVVGAIYGNNFGINQATPTNSKVGDSLALFPGVQVNLFDYNTKFPSVVNGYFWGYHASFQNQGAGAASCDIQLSASVNDGFGTLRSDIGVYRMVFQAAAGLQVIDSWTPARPIIGSVPLGQNTLQNGDVFSLWLDVFASAGTWLLRLSCPYVVDAVNQNPLYDFPTVQTFGWNPDNPQTY